MTEREDRQRNTDDLNRIIVSLEAIVRNLERIIHGKQDSSEPEGLIHQVHKNTEFRRVVTAWLWLLTGSIMTIGAQVFFDLLTLMSK